MHAGAQDWLAMLSEQRTATHLVEYDVEDCFLNTPRELVMPALQLWLNFAFKRRRVADCFAISKYGKCDDYIGRPCSIQSWSINAAVVVAVVQWELENKQLAF